MWASVTFVLMSERQTWPYAESHERRACPYKEFDACRAGERGGKASSAELGEGGKVPEGSTGGKINRRQIWRNNTI